MVGGSTNKLTVAGLNRADKKASTFNAAKFSLVGNNSTGDNIFGRNKRWEKLENIHASIPFNSVRKNSGLISGVTPEL
jgi:hypothetical protein